MLKTVANFDRIGEENAFAVLARANALAAQGHFQFWRALHRIRLPKSTNPRGSGTNKVVVYATIRFSVCAIGLRRRGHGGG